VSQAVQTLSKQSDSETCTELAPFLAELTELSRRHKIGITGDPVLFCLEDEDLDLNYSSDADSKLTY
jgi:hypothetical protein